MAFINILEQELGFLVIFPEESSSFTSFACYTENTLKLVSYCH